ncbi:hypothetical protein [Kangiella shandongensis]|uniref:hypothetical protein n=1 Tax=Kangiella shandongensis TaxID=2763258 RepID=UPI001CBED610|nr:hypothetical protein [Kangiella shandongensis]
MDTIIKIIAGIIIGSCATWFLLESQLTPQEVQKKHTGSPQVISNATDYLRQDSKGIREQELEAKVVELTEELQESRQELAKAEKTKKAVINRLQRQQEANVSQQQGEPEAGKKNEKYLAEAPESHRRLIEPPKGQMKTSFDFHKDFVDEEMDISWALEKEQQITSYIQHHKRGSEVSLKRVKCKKTICEIYGETYSQKGEAWSQITEGMRGQPWWDFLGSSSSTSGSAVNSGQYLFASILYKNF